MSKIDEYDLHEAIVKCKVDMLQEFAKFGDPPDISGIDRKAHISAFISRLPTSLKYTLGGGYPNLSISSTALSIDVADKLISRRDEIFAMLQSDIIDILHEIGIPTDAIYIGASFIQIDVKALKKALDYDKMAVLL